MSRFALFFLVLLAACSHDDAVVKPHPVAGLEDLAFDQDWRDATDCVMHALDRDALKRWPMRASSQAAAFDFKKEASRIVVRNTEDMSALYEVRIEKADDLKSRLSVIPLGGGSATYKDMIEADLKRAAVTCG